MKPALATAHVFCALLVTTPGAVASTDPAVSMTTEIIDTIEDFESTRDAKCYATATRLENFIYGTPLSDDARFLKIDLQKQIILRIWQQASSAARARPASQVDASDIAPWIAAYLVYDEDEQKNVSVRLPDRDLLLSAHDFRQYSSIAYALRAILAVQQDQMWMGGEPLLPLADDAVDALRKALDVITLSALALAYQAARSANEREITADRFTEGWAGVTGAAPLSSAMSSATLASTRTKKAGPSRFSTFLTIVAQKIKSYERYNQIEQDRRAALFLHNIEHFYSRFHLAPGGLTLPESLGRASEDYVGQLIALAETSAGERGEHLIRARDLTEALQKLTPHKVDDLEDVTFFQNLGASERVVLAAFDLDSFRDFGMHWRLMDVMLEMERIEFAMEPDPFAAELVAEGLAQYAVLLLRIAGDIARDDDTVPYVSGLQLAAAASEVDRLASLHHATPAKVRRAAPIRSSRATRRTPSDRFMTEATTEVGIDFQHRSSNWLNRFRRETPVVPPTFSGGGLAAGDVNGDGRADLLFLGGLGNTLYLDTGNGSYKASSQTEQLTFNGRDGLPGEPRQPIIADFDNDGDQDILITYVDSPHRLLRNLGGGRLEEATATAGLGGEQAVAGPATAFDFDRDGLLDLYICYFGNYLKDHGSGKRVHSLRDFPGDLPTLARNNTNAMPNRLYRNLGGLRFEEVKDSGAADRGWCQGVSHTDFDGDGRQDLVVANDFGRNSLLQNLGNGRFEDVSEALGMTRSYHSMNVGVADLNADQFPDLYISNINMMPKDNRYVLPDENTTAKLGAEEMADAQIVESSVLYMSDSDGDRLRGYEASHAAERSSAVGWAWDAEFFDFDNDGDDDLYVANGANEYFNYLSQREVDGGDGYDWNMEPNVFYVNEGGLLRNLSAQSGANFPGNSRAAVYVDPDGDGDLDIVINNFHGPATFFRNDLRSPDAHWLKIRLEGDPSRGSNRDAIGARIVATPDGGSPVWREIHGGSGYLSMEPKEQHFGLGSSRQVDLEIRWPGGGIQHVRGLGADRRWSIRENEAPQALSSR